MIYDISKNIKIEMTCSPNDTLWPHNHKTHLNFSLLNAWGIRKFWADLGFGFVQNSSRISIGNLLFK